MTHLKNRILSSLLIITMLLGLWLPKQNASAAQSPSIDLLSTQTGKTSDESTLALELKLTNDQIIKNSGQNLTTSDFCYMLDRLLETKLGVSISEILDNPDFILAAFDNSGTYGSKGQFDLSKQTIHTVYGTTVEQTLLLGHPEDGSNDLNLPGINTILYEYKALRKAAGSTTINRQTAALWLWRIARLIGFDRDNANQDFETYGGYKWEDSPSGGFEYNNAFYFVCGTQDQNGNRIMTAATHADTKVWFMPEKLMNTGDAVKAVYRLYNAAIPDVALLEDVPILTLSPSLKSAISSCTLPAARYNALPYWVGVNLTQKALISDNSESNGETMHEYTEDQIRYLSELGFNSVRTMVNYRFISSYYDEEMILMDQLENIDQLIEWGAKYNVHITLDLNTLPGWNGNGTGNRDLATDPKEQELAIRYWKMLAKHYQNIPNNILSFNLYNEPHMVDDDKDGVWIATEDFWIPFTRSLIKAIKSYDGDRLIIVDAFLLIDPFEELQNEQVAHSIHVYDPGDLSMNTYAGTPPLEYKGSWPIPIVPDVIYGTALSHDIPFTIKGDFPAGTKVTVDITAFTSNSERVKFVVELSGGTGSTYCKSDSLSKNYTGKLTITTTADTNQLTIFAEPVTPGLFAYFQMNDLVIKKPNGVTTDFYLTKIVIRNQPLDARGYQLVVNEDGSYSSNAYIGNDSSRGIKDSWYDYYLNRFYALRNSASKTDFICGEFGTISYTSEPLVLGVYNTLLQKFQANKIGWQVFAATGNFGFLYSGYKDTVLQEGYPVNKNRLQTLQKYMLQTPIKEEVKSISLSKSSLNLEISETYQLTAAVSNRKTATNPRIGWFTTNRSVVAVDSTGKLIVKGSGTAVITAESVDGSGVVASCTITVPEAKQESLQLVKYSSKSDYDKNTNVVNVGTYGTFDEIKAVMDKSKKSTIYYEIELLSEEYDSEDITLSSYAKSIRINGTELSWDSEGNHAEYTRLVIDDTFTTKTNVTLQRLSLCSKKDTGTLFLSGNGKTITLDNCSIEAGKLDGKGNTGKTHLLIKNDVSIDADITNLSHLTVGTAVKVEKNSDGSLNWDTYQYEVAKLQLNGNLDKVTTLSSYEGRLVLSAASSAVFQALDGVDLFLYLETGTRTAKVTYTGQITSYYGVYMMTIAHKYMSNIYSSTPTILKSGKMIASITSAVTIDSVKQIKYVKDTETMQSVYITRDGSKLLSGKITGKTYWK